MPRETDDDTLPEEADGDDASFGSIFSPGDTAERRACVAINRIYTRRLVDRGLVAPDHDPAELDEEAP